MLLPFDALDSLTDKCSDLLFVQGIVFVGLFLEVN